MIASLVKLVNNNAVFITAGPDPRMRFKRVQCPIGVLSRVGLHTSMILRCNEEALLFFKNVAICPVHGVIPTAEPWIEGNGGKS